MTIWMARIAAGVVALLALTGATAAFDFKADETGVVRV